MIIRVMDPDFLAAFSVCLACVLAGWLLAHRNVWIFRRKQSRMLREWAARFPRLRANPSPKIDQFHGETECVPASVAEFEDELERARR